jgi:hypothetical protein
MNDQSANLQAVVAAALAPLAARIEQLFAEQKDQAEHELYRLNSEVAVIQHRLSQLEGAGASS